VEVQLRERANVFTVTGLIGLGRDEVYSVLKQVLERANVDSQIAFPEAGTRYGYTEIASEKEWDSVYNQIPSASAPIDYSPVTFEKHLALIDAERARRRQRDPQFEKMMMSEWSLIQQQCSDAFLNTDTIALEKRQEHYDNVTSAEQMVVTPIIGLRGVQGVDGDIVGDLGRRKAAEAMCPKPPRQRDRVSTPDLGMPPMSEEEQRLENEDLIRSKGTSPGVINPYKDWNN